MPAAVKQFWTRASTQFQAFSKAQRIAMIGAAVAVLVLVFLFTRWSGKTDMAALYTDLEAVDAAEITERLSSKGVSYELADQGKTVMVPRDKLYELRLELSADGLPSGGSGGWSILDNTGITTSEFAQQVGYQRALEGELARTVASLDAVQTATVHLVLPKRDAFVLSETKASASVLVRTRAGKSLTSSQVQAIVNLVSSSVQGLEPDAVTVADTAGNVLNAPGQSVAGGSIGNTRIEQTTAFENSLASEIQAMLGSVVGVGKAVVTVNADLDFDKTTATSETFTAPTADGTPLAQQESERTEEYTGVIPGDAGVLGPTATIESASGDTSYTLQERTAQNAVNRVVETTERAPGAIERLSVAVLLDEGVVDAARIAEVENLVAAAAGVSPERGDQLVVTTLPFDTSLDEATAEELAALEAQQKREERMRLYTTIGAVVVVLAILVLAYRALTKSHRRKDDEPIDLRDSAMEELEATSVFEELEEGEEADLELDEAEVPELPAAPEMTEEDILAAKLGSQVAAMVEQQPDEVALLLRTWLGDRRAVRR